MEKPDHSPHPFEPKQNELPPKANYDFALDRRKFFKLTGGGLIVAFVLKDLLSFGSETPPSEASSMPGVESWIHIGEDGTVSVYTGKVEVGQNIRTSLSQIVAEELMVPVLSIKMIMGDTDLVPYDAGTFGSRTTPQMGTQLRKAAATARQGTGGHGRKKMEHNGQQV
jgi:isoquinoline 1-oxidoreductase